MSIKLTAQLVAASDGRGKGNTLLSAELLFDADLAAVYAERLAAGSEAAERWLADLSEVELLKKCRVVYRLEHGSEAASQTSLSDT